MMNTAQANPSTILINAQRQGFINCKRMGAVEDKVSWDRTQVDADISSQFSS